jgi:hypothetical protein
MARYRKVDPRIWNDAKFRSLSDDGKLVFLFLMTNPHMTSLGAMRETIPGLASELDWKLERFSKAFGEAFRKGMAKHDPKASFIWLPNFLKYNVPENPNVVRSWGSVIDYLPECALLGELLEQLKAFTEGLGEAFAKAFAKALPEGARKGMPKQEPDPEPEQEHEPEQDQSGSPAAEKRAGQADLAHDAFAIEFKARLGTAYVSKKADFIQLAALRKANGILGRAAPESWDRAIENYFASPLTEYGLAHLASKFATYLNSPTDRYGVPTNHQHAGGKNGKSKHDRNVEAAREILSDLHSSDRGSSVG